MKYVIRNASLIEQILTDELKPDSGLNDRHELGLIKDIRDKMRKTYGEPDLTKEEVDWLRGYLGRWIQEW